MTKCIRLYSDSSSELAKSESGRWFYREYTFNRYVSAYGWTKWIEVGELKSIKRLTTTFENLNGNEITEHRLQLDFQTPSSATDTYYFKLSNKRDVKHLRYKLPN